MDEELIGYISGNINRERIIKFLDSRGAEKSEVIAKQVRIPSRTVSKILLELTEKGLVEQDGEKFMLSAKGEEAIREIMKIK